MLGHVKLINIHLVNVNDTIQLVMTCDDAS